MERIRMLRWCGGVVAALAVIAIASPQPWHITDRGLYETIARRRIVPQCDDLHCFRILVPWTLGSLPGPSLVRWKAYAVVSNTIAALAVLQLCLTFGLSRRTARFAALASAFGFGSLYTLYDPYTSDPLIFALGPIVTNAALSGHVAAAGTIAAAGVFAKEFAAAPLYIVTGYWLTERRWTAALQAFVAANAAFVAWSLLTLVLMLRFDYAWAGAYGGSLGAGGILSWMQKMSGRGMLSAMFNEFGALYLLAPAGLLLAPKPLRRVALVSAPIAAMFGYLQQPDRALWNVHFLVTPLAAVALERVPGSLAWATLATFAIGNLRLGAQLPIAAVSRPAIVMSLVLAAISGFLAIRTFNVDRRYGEVAPPDRAGRSQTKPLLAALAAQGIVLAMLLVPALDLFVHRQTEQQFGVNARGYRDRQMRPKRENELRLVVTGGVFAFGPRVLASETLAPAIRRLLEDALRQHGDQTTSVTAADLGAIGLAPDEYADWIARSAGLEPDVVCLLIDPEDQPADSSSFLPNRRSLLFTRYGYSPILPSALREQANLRWAIGFGAAAAALNRLDRALAPVPALRVPLPYVPSIEAAAEAALRLRSATVLVVLPPQRRREGNDDVRRALEARFSGEPRLRVVDLNEDAGWRSGRPLVAASEMSAADYEQAAEDIVPSLSDLIRERGRRSP